jgi:membrane protein insertase Oxa1/YidC/SpoIIIJ
MLASIVRNTSRTTARARASTFLTCAPRTPQMPRARQVSGIALAAEPLAAATASCGPLELVQHSLVAFQATTGLPWCLSIAASAVAFRVALLPTVVYQVREMRRFAALQPSFEAIRRRCARIESPQQRAIALASGVLRHCRQEGVRPLAAFGLPLLQIPVLLGLVLSVRGMLQPGTPLAPALQHGGTLWFHNLTRADETGVLPLVALLLLLANLQNAASAASGPIWLGIRNTIQAAAVVALPLYSELPCGVFMYWIPNSLWSSAQSALVRRSMTVAQPRGLSLAPLAPAARAAARDPKAVAAAPAAAARKPAQPQPEKARADETR